MRDVTVKPAGQLSRKATITVMAARKKILLIRYPRKTHERPLDCLELMTGEPCNWEEWDEATSGEGIARCPRLECCAPLRFVIGPTLVVFRCDFGHVLSLH